MSHHIELKAFLLFFFFGEFKEPCLTQHIPTEEMKNENHGHVVDVF